MTWINENWLWGLWLLPLLGILFFRSARKSRDARTLFFSRKMEEELAPHHSRGNRIIRSLLFLLGLGFFITAAAGPESAGTVEKVSRNGADIFVLLDLSRSMLSDDRKPSRLESAKLDIEDLLQTVSGDRFGLIVFAGKPALSVPLTEDRGFFRETLKKADPRSVPRGGTAIGDAIRLALRSLPSDPNRDRALVLITDGEDHDSMPEKAAEDAAKQGVRIFCVALGDAEEGGRIPIFDKTGKRTGYQKYGDQEIWTKADRKLLTRIAEITDGAFLDAGTAPADLAGFCKREMRNLKRTRYAEEERVIRQEKYQPFLGTGIILILCALFISPFRIRKSAASLIFAAILFPLPLYADFPNQPEPNPFSGNSQNRGISPPKLNLSLPGELGLPDKTETPEENAEEPLSANSADTADSKEEKPISVPAESEPEKLTAADLYNNACRLIESGDEENARELLNKSLELCKAKEKKLRARICANLGYLSVKEAAKKTEDLNTAKPESDTKETDAQAEPEKENKVKEYRKEAGKRNTEQTDIQNIAKKGIAYFQESAAEGDRGLRTESERRIDLVRSWLADETAAAEKRERTIRETEFQPLDHLRWLSEELEKESENQVLIDPEINGDTFQKRHLLEKELRIRGKDLDSLLEKGVFSAAAEKENQKQVETRKESLETALTLIKKGADSVQENPAETLTSLREGLGAIDEAELTLTDYPNIVTGSIEIQKKTLETAQTLQENRDVSAEPKESSRLKNSDSFELNNLLWRNLFTDRRVRRMKADAAAEFESKPLTDAETEEQESEKEKPEEKENPILPVNADGMKKIRQSMKLALELGPEIEKEIRTMENFSEEELKKEAADRETHILELLQKIAEPLQDPNQQNQDNQNQDQQDQNNQDQNQQDQDQQDQQNQNEQNQAQQDPQNQQDQKNQDQQESAQNKKEQLTPEEREEAQKKENAEGMMRKVRARQQSAEELRREREAQFQRREKPEKDW